MSFATPQEVVARLEDLYEQIATNANALEGAAYDYFTRKRNRDVFLAKELVRLRPLGGAVEDRKAEARANFAETDDYGLFVAAEATYESLKLAQKSLGDRANVGMSILKAQGRA